MAALANLPLSRSDFDRDGAARLSEGFLSRMLLDERSRLLFVSQRRVPVAAGALVFHSIGDLPERFTAAVYLGRSLSDAGALSAGDSVIAVVLDDAGDTAPGGDAWLGLREAGGVLGDRDAGIAVEAVAVAGWHAGSSRCTRCGGATSIEHAGWMRRCAGCGLELFPRTDPAVIVRVTDADDRILLGSNAMWPAGRYSLFAGFVEAGESLEAAVVREVYEEAGVRVADPEYLGSQPWPFPQSLMIGFAARLRAGEDAEATQPDGEEILDVRWFTREELDDPDNGIQLPGETSIAHHIIRQWRDARP